MADGYTHPELLVETDWLRAHLDDPSVRVVDADYPASYARAHIPGSVGHIAENVYLKTANGETFLMGPEQFAETMAKMGIGDDTLVVAYDSHMSLLAARFWWALSFYGHANAKILNGGWHKWLAEGRPATMAAPKIDASQYTFTPRIDDSVLGSCDLMKADVGNAGVAFLDVRTDGEWNGTLDRGNKRRGRIPGAVHIEWTNFVTADDFKVFKPAAELRQMLRAEGVTPDKNVYTY